MAEPSVVHSTFVIERSYAAAAERVFGAFAEPARKRRWFLEGERQEVEAYEMDFRVDGRESARLRLKEGTPLPGVVCASETIYEDIEVNRRIVFASRMVVGGRCISAALGTLEFLPTDGGTELIFTHQGAFFEGADGPVMREAGWRLLLENLGRELGG